MFYPASAGLQVAICGLHYVMPPSAGFLVLHPPCEIESPRRLRRLASRLRAARAFRASRTAVGRALAGSSAAANSVCRGEAQNRCRFGVAATLSAVASIKGARRFLRQACAAVLRRVAAISRGYALCVGPGITWQSTRTSYRPAFAGLLSAGHFYVMPRSAELLVLESQCDLEWLRPARKLASRVRRVRALRAPRTAVGCSFRGFVGRREQCVLWGSSEPLSVWGRCDAEGSRRHPPGPDARARSVCRFPAASGGSLKRARPLHRLWHNMAIDTDVLSAGFRRPTVRRSFLRYAFVR
jgi:hypothetical protein